MRKKSNAKSLDIPVNPRGQSGMLQRISQKTYVIVYAGIIFLLIFIGLYAYSNQSRGEQLENTVFLNQYRLGSKILTESVQSYAVTGIQDYYDNYFKELNEDKNRDIAWQGLQDNHLKEDEWATLQQIADMSNGLVPLEEEAMDAVAAGDLQTAQDAVFGTTYEDTVAQISSLTDDCINKIQNRMQRKQSVLNIIMLISIFAFTVSFIVIVEQIKKIMQFSRRELLLPIIKVSDLVKNLAQGNFQNETDMREDESEVGIMIASINFMNQNFTKMISEISNVLDKMGNGNYTVSLQEQYVGDFIAIKDSMEKIIEDTRHTLTTIRNSANEIGGGSEQLANAATDLAEGCTTQATQVSEVSEAVDHMAKIMEEKAKDAADAVSLSTHAGEVLMGSNAKMQELKEAISEINHCSDQIRDIIGVIEDIASQTSLLSLNASIEAARAGEAGRGFAVVAEQVKNLAEQSTQAAGETTKLIENTVQAVEKGITISDEAVANMNDVMVSAKEATDKMSEMAETMRRESDSMRSINDSVSKVAEIVDSNSAASEETAAVSEEQTAQVQTMVQMMDQFEI